MSFYIGGKRWGPAIEFKTGGGAVLGVVDKRGDLSGDNITYAYPDFK